MALDRLLGEEALRLFQAPGSQGFLGLSQSQPAEPEHGDRFPSPGAVSRHGLLPGYVYSTEARRGWSARSSRGPPRAALESPQVGHPAHGVPTTPGATPPLLVGASFQLAPTNGELLL